MFDSEKHRRTVREWWVKKETLPGLDKNVEPKSPGATLGPRPGSG